MECKKMNDMNIKKVLNVWLCWYNK